jgi:hypothetical protein
VNGSVQIRRDLPQRDLPAVGTGMYICVYTFAEVC